MKARAVWLLSVLEEVERVCSVVQGAAWTIAEFCKSLRTTLTTYINDDAKG